MPPSDSVTPAWACARYEAVRGRLPTAHFPEASKEVSDLGQLIDEFDAFVLDGFGVLNVGDSAIPGAPERVAALRAAGKRVLVLTNGATLPREQVVAKYRRLGFDFAAQEIVSSRDALAAGLMAQPDAGPWGFAATDDSRITNLAAPSVLLTHEPAPYAAVKGFVLLSSLEWSRDRQELLIQALRRQPRPVLVGNPDLVAPHAQRLSLEPGFFAHELADRLSCKPMFFGKPFGDVFDLANARLDPPIAPQRIAMVGDTLHTDILGGAAYGWGTILIPSHGLLKTLDSRALCEQSGIRPDFVALTI